MSQIKEPDPITYDAVIMLALDEDLHNGDVTSDNLSFDKGVVKGHLLAHETGILAGLSIFKRVFKLVDEEVLDDNFREFFEDTQEVSAGDVIAEITMHPLSILKGERVALNLITHLSGIATLTSQFVKIISDNKTKITDTRKTLPGLRILQKYAVRVGGGINHRMSLSDTALIKNNHISVAGGITKAIEQVRSGVGHTVKVEVEVPDINGVNEALDADADIIMLDNFSPKEAVKAVEIIGDKAVIELSGGIKIDNIKEYKSVGADIISIGALTHSVKALDMALHIVD